MWFYVYYFFLGQNDETSKFNSEKKLPFNKKAEFDS